MAVNPSKNQEELFQKLKSWVPLWFFENEDIQRATLKAIAKMWEGVDLNHAEHEDQTYICISESKYLEEHAFERNLLRETNEGDPALRDRTKNIVNLNNCGDLKTLIDGLLCTGVSKIIEGSDLVYYNRDNFFNRGDIFATKQYNYFYIVIPKQVDPSREDFYTRDCFFDRDCFYSSSPRKTKQEVYDSITALVNKNKACGTLYFVITT